MAPMSAPKITRQSTTSGAMRPVPMVWATCSPKNRKAMKLKNAAQMTAMLGESTRVETTVAIEFAASCRPLRKSKISATATSDDDDDEASLQAWKGAVPRSNVLDNDALNLVRRRPRAGRPVFSR